MLKLPFHGGAPCTRYAMRPWLWAVGMAACHPIGSPTSPAVRIRRRRCAFGLTTVCVDAGQVQAACSTEGPGPPFRPG